MTGVILSPLVTNACLTPINNFIVISSLTIRISLPFKSLVGTGSHLIDAPMASNTPRRGMKVLLERTCALGDNSTYLPSIRTPTSLALNFRGDYSFVTVGFVVAVPFVVKDHVVSPAFTVYVSPLSSGLFGIISQF